MQVLEYSFIEFMQCNEIFMQLFTTIIKKRYFKLSNNHRCSKVSLKVIEDLLKFSLNKKKCSLQKNQYYYAQRCFEIQFQKL